MTIAGIAVGVVLFAIAGVLLLNSSADTPRQQARYAVLLGFALLLIVVSLFFGVP